MQKYSMMFRSLQKPAADEPMIKEMDFYLASEVDARIAELESLLRRASGNLYHPFEPKMIEKLEAEIEKALSL
jgi:hypothetical protein